MTGFDYDKIKDPTFFKENVWKAHSAHSFFANKGELTDVSSLYLNLNGVWNFHYAKNLDCSIKGFETLEYDCRSWDTIRVPAHIQMEGYDIPQYANVQYPWDGREELIPGEVPVSFNPVASYVKYFTIPENMKNKEIHIRFEGVESGFVLWLNGSYVGYSEDSFTASEFDLTPYLLDGENKLALQVFKWTSSSWCEDQDFFRFSGIFRSVVLMAIPKVHVEDIFLKTLFEEQDFSKSTLSMEFVVRGEGQIKVSLKKQGEEIFSLVKDTKQTEKVMTGSKIRPIEASFIEITKEVLQPELWSAENPFLYDLEIISLNGEGQEVEFIKQAVGFRKFEMKNNRMLLNGKRIVFKGVNRHEFSSITGRVVSYDELEKDLRTMKRNNINAIRTCHYPDEERIYDLCDKYGFYLIAENNLESHGSWDAYFAGKKGMDFIVPDDKPMWKEMMFDRVRSTFNRDKNHPSILIWSCGNEAFGGETIFEMSHLFRELDNTRLVHYEGVFNDRRYNDTSDMESRMYAKVTDIEAYLSEGDVKPFICCEYTHAMGNSCGAMHKYTELADSENSGYQGGFIWDYIDQSIYKKDRYGNWFQAYGGDFKDRPCDYNFSGNGIAYGGERNESPKMQEVKFNYQNIAITVHQDTFEVWNKNLFTNTDQWDCVATLMRNGVTIAKETIKGILVLPESKKTFPHPFTSFDLDGEYIVTISFVTKKEEWYADASFEVAFGQAVVAKIEKKQAILKSGPLKVIHGNHNIGVKGDTFDILFSYWNGGLVSYRYAGKEMIADIPKPNFWRAPTDNDGGNNMVGSCSQWKLASMYATTKNAGKKVGDKLINPVIEEKTDSVVVTYYYQFQTRPNAECSLSYEVFADGTVSTTLAFDPSSAERLSKEGAELSLQDMPEFGVIMKVDADYEWIEWYGNGPKETYADREKGAKLGIYKGKVSEQMAEYLVPQECGNKTKIRFAKVMDLKGRGLLFSGDEMNFSALPYTPHEIENAKHAYELPNVHYTVIRVSKAQMGIGGDDSWGAPVHEEYHLKPDCPYSFSFTFKGI